MPDSKKELSVVVVNYQSKRYLEDCVASLFDKLGNKINLEVIVVNNDETESVQDVLKDFSEIKLINHKKNIGFGAACNMGSRLAKGDALFFLNPDTEVLSDNFIRIFRKLTEDKNIGAIGPRLLTEDGRTQRWCAGKEFTLRRLIKNNLGMNESKAVWESRQEIFVDWVSGAALLVRKDIFIKVGGFDERFFMYFEDDDLCRRIRELGYKILYYPKISILHKGGRSRKNILTQKMQFFQSMSYYVKKKIKRKPVGPQNV